MLLATLVVGIALGVLGASTLQNRRVERIRDTRERGGVTRFLMRVLKTENEALSAEVQSVVREAEQRFRQVRAQCSDSLTAARNAMLEDIKTYLTPEQQERLEAWKCVVGTAEKFATALSCIPYRQHYQAMNKILLVIGVLVLSGASVWYFNRDDTETANPYRFVTIERGDIESVVTSTGTLDAVTTVEVGTQVSGIISHIYVDFNDRVRRGQVVARIDTTLLTSAVRDAEANVERTRHKCARRSGNSLASRDFSTNSSLPRSNTTGPSTIWISQTPPPNPRKSALNAPARI